jgi:transposase
MKKILAIDMGKFNSVACLYGMEGDTHQFETVLTQPTVFHDLFVLHEPDRVVIEIGSQAGWVCDLAEALEIEIQVANTNHDAWRWKNTKRKTDRDDALKLARLSAMNQLPLVTLPDSQVRQWRSLIGYRHTLVGRRTAIKNSIRSILDRQGIRWPSGKSGWTYKALSILQRRAQPIADVDVDHLWRGQLHVELQALQDQEELIQQVERKLEELAAADKRVQLLRTIPGVGPRLAEVVVAVIDDPRRFKNGKQVGAYAGLVPKQYESGTMQRHGRITGQGNKLLRALLVEVSWLMRRYNGHFCGVFDQVCRGSKARRKIAVVAVARRLLICCWAMLRDGTRWRDPSTNQTMAVPA